MGSGWAGLGGRAGWAKWPGQGGWLPFEGGWAGLGPALTLPLSSSWGTESKRDGWVVLGYSLARLPGWGWAGVGLGWKIWRLGKGFELGWDLSHTFKENSKLMKMQFKAKFIQFLFIPALEGLGFRVEFLTLEAF